MPAAGKLKTLQETVNTPKFITSALMLALFSCVTALHMGGDARPLLRARPSSLRAQAPTGVEFWAEPSNPNLVTERLDGAVTSHTPMIFWASQIKKKTRQHQVGSEEAPPPHGASTGVTSWYDHMQHACACACACTGALSVDCMYWSVQVRPRQSARARPA